MTLTELAKSIYDSSTERIKTPITGSFSLAFVLYNWRPILLLLFSKDSIENKIQVIDIFFSSWHAIVVPLLIALLYVVIVPYLMMVIEILLNTANVGRKTNRSEQQLLDLTLKSKLLSQKFKNTQIESGEKDIKELNDTIANMQSQITIINDQHKSVVENYESIIVGYKNADSENSRFSKSLSEMESNFLYMTDYLTTTLKIIVSLLTPEQLSNILNLLTQLMNDPPHNVNTHLVNMLIEYEFVEDVIDNKTGFPTFKVTELGEMFRDNFLNWSRNNTDNNKNITFPTPSIPPLSPQ